MSQAYKILLNSNIRRVIFNHLNVIQHAIFKSYDRLLNNFIIIYYKKAYHYLCLSYV